MWERESEMFGIADNSSGLHTTKMTSKLQFYVTYRLLLIKCVVLSRLQIFLLKKMAADNILRRFWSESRKLRVQEWERKRLWFPIDKKGRKVNFFLRKDQTRQFWLDIYELGSKEAYVESYKSNYHDDSQWGKALPMRCLRETVPSTQHIDQSLQNPHRRKTI